MKCNPWLDYILPTDATEARIRAFYTQVYPSMPPEQKEYARMVLLSLAELPEDIHRELRA